MVDWLAGNRIRGTNTERTSTTGFNPVSGGWKELGRSSGTAPSITSLANKRYLMILGHAIRGSGAYGAVAMRFNNDTSGNYAKRTSEHGNTDSARIDQIKMQALVEHSNVTGNHSFNVQYVANLATKEKLMIGHGVHSSSLGSGYAVGRQESVFKWDNTSDAINRVDMFDGESDTWGTSSECVVLGWDPDDTHTTNFWEELASVTLGSAGDTLDSGTIAAKKYLWVQVFAIATGNLDNCKIRYNGSSSSDYAFRASNNGGADSTNINESGIVYNGANAAQNHFVNIFIINISAREKLSIGHTVRDGGAGVGNSPDRKEWGGKWDITGSQITSIQAVNAGAGSFDTGSIIKVWGSN